MKRLGEWGLFIIAIGFVFVMLRNDLSKPSPVEKVCENIRQSGATCVVSDVELKAQVIQVTSATNQDSVFLVILKDDKPVDVIQVR